MYIHIKSYMYAYSPASRYVRTLKGTYAYVHMNACMYACMRGCLYACLQLPTVCPVCLSASDVSVSVSLAIQADAAGADNGCKADSAVSFAEGQICGQAAFGGLVPRAQEDAAPPGA